MDLLTQILDTGCMMLDRIFFTTDYMDIGWWMLGVWVWY